jgi:hypothetical protein
MDEIEIKVRKAIEKADLEKLDEAISELLEVENISNYVNLLNDLLLVTFHRQHQYIARAIQDLETASSVPFIDRVLESKFEGIPYTGSDSDSMAKWFSWALYCIGTDEAIGVIRKHTNSEDEGIRKEMQYRLDRIESEKS